VPRGVLSRSVTTQLNIGGPRGGPAIVRATSPARRVPRRRRTGASGRGTTSPPVVHRLSLAVGPARSRENQPGFTVRVAGPPRQPDPRLYRATTCLEAVRPGLQKRPQRVCPAGQQAVRTHEPNRCDRTGPPRFAARTRPRAWSTTSARVASGAEIGSGRRTGGQEGRGRPGTSTVTSGAARRYGGRRVQCLGSSNSPQPVTLDPRP